VAPGGSAPFSDSNVGFFQGRLDDIQIYNRALTGLEVNRLRNPDP
jgi:hypothetical protein